MGVTTRAKGGLFLAIFPLAEVRISPYKAPVMKLGGGWVAQGPAPRRSRLVVACAHSNMLRVTRQLPKILTCCRKACGLMGGFGRSVWACVEEFCMPGKPCAKNPRTALKTVRQSLKGNLAKQFWLETASETPFLHELRVKSWSWENMLRSLLCASDSAWKRCWGLLSYLLSTSHPGLCHAVKLVVKVPDAPVSNWSCPKAAPQFRWLLSVNSLSVDIKPIKDCSSSRCLLKRVFFLFIIF